MAERGLSDGHSSLHLDMVESLSDTDHIRMPDPAQTPPQGMSMVDWYDRNFDRYGQNAGPNLRQLSTFMPHSIAGERGHTRNRRRFQNWSGTYVGREPHYRPELWNTEPVRDHGSDATAIPHSIHENSVHEHSLVERMIQDSIDDDQLSMSHIAEHGSVYSLVREEGGESLGMLEPQPPLMPLADIHHRVRDIPAARNNAVTHNVSRLNPINPVQQRVQQFQRLAETSDVIADRLEPLARNRMRINPPRSVDNSVVRQPQWGRPSSIASLTEHVEYSPVEIPVDRPINPAANVANVRFDRRPVPMESSRLENDPVDTRC